MFRVLIIAVFLMAPSMAEEEQVTLLNKDAEFVAAESGMSDDVFFKQYADTCHAYIEKYIADKELFDYNNGEKNPDAEQCRNKVNELVDSARCFYESHMEFADSCLSNKVEESTAKKIRSAYRTMLRCCLLEDLSGLVYGAWGYYSKNNCWEAENEEKYEPFERNLQNYIHSVASSDRCFSAILEMRQGRLKHMREILQNLMVDDDRERDILTRTDKNVSLGQIRCFREAERAWDFYFEAVKECHAPVIVPGSIGSGFNESWQILQAELLRSHLKMLTEMLQLRD